MTKKDYIKFADSYKQVIDRDHRDINGSIIIDKHLLSTLKQIKLVADVLRMDNGRFDYNKFYAAILGQSYLREVDTIGIN